MATLDNGVVAALALGLDSIFDLPPAIWSASEAVREVNVSFNAITASSLPALAPFSAHLKTLILDNNELTDLEGLPPLPHLVTLWLNNNSIAELEGVLNILAKQCPQLEYLSLLRNPCCPNELTGRLENEYRRYRLYTKYRLPTLKTLDTAKFTDEETAEAKEKGKFFRTAVAKAPTEEGATQQTNANFGRQQAKEETTTAASTAAPATEADEEEDLFAKFEKKKTNAPADPNSQSNEATAPSYFSQQRHFYSGKTSEGNRFIRDDVL